MRSHADAFIHLVRRQLRFRSRTLEIDSGLEAFTERRAAALLGAFPLRALEVAVEREGVGKFRCRVRVAARKHVAVGVVAADTVRAALTMALSRAASALRRAHDRDRRKSSRWKLVASAAVMSGALGCATIPPTNPRLSARTVGPEVPERALVIPVHLAGGEPDARGLRAVGAPSTDRPVPRSSWKLEPTRAP